MTARPVDINFPQTWEEFMRMPQLQTAEILYKDVHGYRFVLKLVPGVVLKHGARVWRRDTLYEAGTDSGPPSAERYIPPRFDRLWVR